MIRKILHNLFARAGVCYILVIAGLMWLADTRNPHLHRSAMLQLYAQYPVQLLYGEAVYDQKSLRQSIRYYRTLDQVFPRLIDSKALLGISYARIGNPAKARPCLNEACQLNPAFFWNRYNLGLLDYQSGRLNEAEAAFRSISRLNTADLRVIPFPPEFLKKWNPETQTFFLREALLFNMSIQYFSRLMLLECLGRKGQTQSVISLATRFAALTADPEHQFALILRAVRAIDQIASDKAVASYLITLADRQSFAQNAQLQHLFKTLKDAQNPSAILERLNSRTLPPADHYVIPPWRKRILAGREFF